MWRIGMAFLVLTLYPLAGEACLREPPVRVPHRSAEVPGKVSYRSVHYPQGVALLKEGKTREGVALLVKAAKEGDAYAALHLGAHFARTGEPVEAHNWFEEATRLGAEEKFKATRRSTCR